MKTDLFGNPTQAETLREHPQLSQESYSEFPKELSDTNLEDLEPTKRPLWGIQLAVVGVLSLLGYQCFQLQVSRAAINKTAAEGNSVRILTRQPDRGLIEDASGTILAHNNRQVALAINPQTLPHKRAERDTVYTTLRAHITLTDEQIQFIEKNRLSSPETFAIKTNLSQEDNLLYRQWFADVPGVVLTELPTRRYAELPSLGQLLGYVGPVSDDDVKLRNLPLNQRVGKNGLEKYYNDQLTGTPGKEKAEVNANGDIIRFIADGQSSAPHVGQTLKLSLDTHLQQIVADALQHELDRRTVKYGPQPKLGASAVLMDPQTGAIKAMVSLPDYSSNLFANGISTEDFQTLTSNPGNPLLNRTIQGLEAPGSTLKPLVAAGGLQDGVITGDTQMNTPDAITINGFRFPDWKVHGQTNTRKALAESNNIFFYSVGGGWAERNFKGLGINRLNYYLAQFGLGSKTGIDLPGESTGLLPDEAWKQKQTNEPWYIGDTYHSSIGQGYLLTTPLQMATATAAIANGGTLYQPHLAQSFIDPLTQTEAPVQPVVTRNVFIGPVNVQIVQEGMRQAVTEGSARLLNGLKVTSAGKTGTAQFGNQGLTHAWYTGFAPYDKPTLAFAVLIEGGGESFYSSVPVVEEILRGAFNEPLEPGQQLLSEPSAERTAQIAAEYAGER